MAGLWCLNPKVDSRSCSKAFVERDDIALQKEWTDDSGQYGRRLRFKFIIVDTRLNADYSSRHMNVDLL